MSNVVWAPQPGSQEAFLACPIFEVLYEGTRGPGKTDALLMDFAQHVGLGYGAAWRGVLFRQTHPQLADVIAKSEKWFPLIWPRAKYNRGNFSWEWPTGEVLLLRHFEREAHYWNYHGHEYPWIGWEELCNWSDLGGYRRMISCCRSSHKGMPRKYRATTNPYGPGHNLVKFRFRLPAWRGRVIEDAVDVRGNPEPPRVAIHGNIYENKILLEADPHYIANITAAARNDSERKAWLEGSWDIVAGGMFDDVWDPAVNVVPRFEIPSSWRVDRSFDWGSSHPFSYGVWAESDGSDLLLPDRGLVSTVRGDLFRVHEWYGWNGQPNEGLRALNTDIAKGIVERELRWGLRDHGSCRVKQGPADTMIFDVENGVSIAMDMQKAVRIEGHTYAGPTFTRADKRPGSRVPGWEMMRKMIKHAGRDKGVPREKPGLFVVGVECEHFLRTVPVLPRDDKKLDDVNSESEDHVGDETRYRVRTVGNRAGSGSTVGMY